MGHLSDSHRLLPLCNLTLLVKLSAWHFVHMYDEGLIEPARNPSFNLAWGLNARDRLQYLREMTTGRSIWWLEQGRWLGLDSITGSLSLAQPQLLDITISDMSMLLLLLLTPDSGVTDQTTQSMALLVIQLALLLLSSVDVPKWSFSYMHHCVDQCFNSIRCWKLGGGHLTGIIPLADEMSRNTDLLRDGWEMYCNMLGVKVLSREMPFKNGAIADGLWPLFLNPVKLVGRTWSEVSDQFPFLGHELRSDIASTRFDLTPGTLTYVPTSMDLRPDLAQLADSIALSGKRCYGMPSALLPVPVFPRRQFQEADLRYNEDASRQVLLLRRLSPVIQGILQVQAGDRCGDSRVLAVRDSVREVLVQGLRRGLRICDEAAPLKLSTPMRGRLFLLRVSTTCYCVHRFYKRETQAAIIRVVQAMEEKTSSVAVSAEQEWLSTLVRVLPDRLQDTLSREGYLSAVTESTPFERKWEPSRQVSARLTRLREKLENKTVVKEIKKLQELDVETKVATELAVETKVATELAVETKVAAELAVETNGRRRKVERNGVPKPPNSQPRKPIQGKPKRPPKISVPTGADTTIAEPTSDTVQRGIRRPESQATLVRASASLGQPNSFSVSVGEVVALSIH